MVRYRVRQRIRTSRMNFNMDVGLVVISVAYARDISEG